MPYYSGEYLSHYGIKGQKWGIRRFQNEDGSLTPEGRERYSEQPNEAKTWQTKEAPLLSDAELNRRINRLQRERQYRDLTTPEVKKESKQIAKDALKKVLIGTAVGVAAIKMTRMYTKMSDSFIEARLKNVPPDGFRANILSSMLVAPKKS